MLILVLFGSMALFKLQHPSLASDPEDVLIITGTGLKEDVSIYSSQWLDFHHPDLEERYYSSNNRFNFHKIWKVKGFDLLTLMGKDNLKNDQDYPITFIASDGAEYTESLSSLTDRYYYPHFTPEGEEPILPMIGFYRTELYDSNDPKPPVTWEDQPLSAQDLDGVAPRLYLGQRQGEMSDANNSLFLRSLIKIVVGEKRDTAHDDEKSPYKHISYDGPPYHVDALTGATMTIAGPGVYTYRAISLRQLQEEVEGIHHETYREERDGEIQENSYEGIRVPYLLDNFIRLRDTVGNILFQDKNRRTIATYNLEQIQDQEKEMMVAYGINEHPLVYTDTCMGYEVERRNDEGCFKLVFHSKDETIPKFSNVAYIYVEEKDAPGIYEHTHPPYDNPIFTNYILSVSGKGLGQEANFTVQELEAMTHLHLEKEYSLSNSEYYWYFNTYKGVPLWDLLLEIGVEEDIPGETPVYFIAADYYNFPPLTIQEIRDHSLYGFYEKDPEDLGDGNFDGSRVKPLDTGYPVLIAYGFNGYPYVIHSSDPGFNSGLGNAGGPLRIIFGKRSYDHTNGSFQVKYAKRIIIGEPKNHTTHSYEPYDSLAHNPLTLQVVGEDGNTITHKKMTVEEIQGMIYDVPAAERDKARVKDYYFTHRFGGEKISDLYEGIGMEYLLFDKVGLPGSIGTVTFKNEAGDTLTVSLDDILRDDYFNQVTSAHNIKPVLAFGKNGYPMVETRDCEGYLGSPIVNRHGPLMALFGQKEEGEPGDSLIQVSSIVVNLQRDDYAHLEPPYDMYGGNTLEIGGVGARSTASFTVHELESRQRFIVEKKVHPGEALDETAVFRGLQLHELLRQEVGFLASATGITFVSASGEEVTLPLEEMIDAHKKALLAFGKNARPLVPDAESPGFQEEARNIGGPLSFLLLQEKAGEFSTLQFVKQIEEIIITGEEMTSWKHEHGIYQQYLDKPVLRITGSEVKEPRTFNLRQIQNLDPYIIQDLYMGNTEVEGVILWHLIHQVVGLKEGVQVPSSIRVYAGPNYNQLPNTEQIMDGVINSQGERKQIILGYARDGYPLVPHSHSDGYINNNEYGPLRLIVEENISMWTKWVDCIVVGHGDYEEPLAQDVIHEEEPIVFTITGDGIPHEKTFTQSQLQLIGESKGEYTYTSGGQVIVDTATGILLADLLQEIGITQPTWKVDIVATDGFNPGTITVQEAIEDQYLITYLVNGEGILDTKEDVEPSTLRMYRHYNDGSNWRNRLTLVWGVEISKSE